MKKQYHVVSCPFCGHLPEITFWHGGGPSKRMVVCRFEGCDVSPSVTGSTADRAVSKWNYRVLPVSTGMVAVTPRNASK